jgi:hypothetical protein
MLGGVLAWIGAILLRQPIGLIGIFMAWLAFIVELGIRKKWNRSHAQLLTALSVGSLITFLTPTGLIETRGLCYHLPPSRHVITHGLSHNLLLGLGSGPNPWGIEWGDSWGYKWIQKFHPSVGYTTPEYYRLIGQLYWRILLHHPRDVLHIYWRKMGELAALPLRFWGLPLIWAYGFMGATLAFVKRAPPFRNTLPYTMALWTACGIFAIQGVLAVPWVRHLYPMKFLLVLTTCSFSDGAVEAALAKLTRRSDVCSSPGSP